MKEFKFEVCANGVESCLAAQEGGADRVELCAGIPEGGTTPSYGEIKTARRVLDRTLLHVIIRPRGGDFLYTPLELERMDEDIRVCKELGADGVVFGCLTQEARVDVEACRRLMRAAKGMSVTFHRAFDRFLFTVTPDCKIEISEQMMERTEDNSFREYLLSINGNNIIMPEKFSPDINLLSIHYEQYRKHQ